MTFINNTTIISATWLNAIDRATYVTIPESSDNIENIQERINIIQSDGWASDINFSSGIDWAKLVGLPTTLSGYGIVDGGTLINVRVFTTADSGMPYSPTPGTNKVVVEVQAGGGAGDVSYGGASGSYATAAFTSNVAGVVMTVGAGGVAGGDANGKASSFGAFILCPGGPSGSYRAFAGSPTGIFQYSNRGSFGETAFGFSVRGSTGGTGGNSKFGTGGIGAYSGTPQTAALSGTGYGSGGGGGGDTSTSYAAGNGAPGAIIIWEYN